MAKLNTSVVQRPIGPSGYGGASALESICLQGNIIWIIKCDIRGSNANKYAKIYRYNIKSKSLKCMDKTFSNLGHANGCTFYNGCIYVATDYGITRVNTSTWKSKKVSDIDCTGIDYYGDNKFIIQLGGNSYGLYEYNGGNFKKLKSFTLQRHGNYTTNQDITYNGGIIYRIAITGSKAASAIMLYNYDGGSGSYKPKKVYTCGGELESMVFYKGKPYISNNMPAPGDAIITTSSFKGGDTTGQEAGVVTGGTEGMTETIPTIPIEYPTTVEITGFYEFYSGQENSQVISFSPEWSDMKAQGGEWLVKSASAVDEIRNEIISTKVDSGNYTKQSKNIGSIMGRSTSSMNSLKTQSQSMWEKNYSRMNTATMEIIGDPDTYPGKYIYVDVYTKYGLRHHTSGIYYVEEAEDNISEGSFTTSLQLRKYGTWSHFYNANVAGSVVNSEGQTESTESGSSGESYLGGEIGNPYGGKTKFSITSIAMAVGYDSAHAGRMHTGWDLAVGGNVPIYSVTSGKVVFAGPMGTLTTGYGTHVVIIKADNSDMYVLYGHMCDMNGLKAGDKVGMGDRIGTQGTEGNSTGNHLHLEFRKGKNSSNNATANLNNIEPMFKKYATNYKERKKDFHLIKTKN